MSEYIIIGIVGCIVLCILGVFYMRVQSMRKQEYEMYLLRKEHANNHLEKPQEADGSVYFFLGVLILVCVGTSSTFVSCEQQEINSSRSIEKMEAKLDSMNNQIQLIECDMRSSLVDTVTVYLNGTR